MTLGKFLKTQLENGGVVQTPDIMKDSDTKAMKTLKRLIERMIRAEPSDRCKIQEVLREVRIIRRK